MYVIVVIVIAVAVAVVIVVVIVVDSRRESAGTGGIELPDRQRVEQEQIKSPGRKKWG